MGRLPTTWPGSETGLPGTQPREGVLRYDERLFVGYRGYEQDGRAPMFAFGHGLGYTSWTYLAIDAPPKIDAGADVSVTVTVRNTGKRLGKEVVQLYANRPDTGIERPLRWLAGFGVVEANAGETVSMTIDVRARTFEHWSPIAGRWLTEPGVFGLAGGASSAALSISTKISIFRGSTSAESQRCPSPDLSSARRAPGLRDHV